MGKTDSRIRRKSGIKVELIQMAWERVADKIVTEMASGGSAFDVIEFDNVWPAKFLSAGWLISLQRVYRSSYC